MRSIVADAIWALGGGSDGCLSGKGGGATLGVVEGAEEPWGGLRGCALGNAGVDLPGVAVVLLLWGMRSGSCFAPMAIFLWSESLCCPGSEGCRLDVFLVAGVGLKAVP